MMMRDGAGRTCVWWQVRHWWYNHVSGPLGSWKETLACYMTPGFRADMRQADEDIRNGDLVPFEDEAEAEWGYLYEEAKMARHYPGDIGCPGLDDFDDREEQG